VLHTAHGFAFHEASPRLATAFYARLERLAAHWCDRILTVSDFHRAWAIRLRLAAPEQVVTVHNGISRSRLVVSRAASDVRCELGVAADAVLLVSAGRLVTQKGLGTMLQALPQVLERVPNTRLVLVGEGPARDALEEQARTAGLSAYVSFLGFRSDVADIVNAADIVVAPSIREGLSISVLEAMALGKPIVATTIGGNLELLDNGTCGLLVRPAEPEQLAEAVLTLALDEDLASRFGAAALERFERCFTERTMKDAVWAAYRPLLEQKLATTRAPAVTGVPA
jgi:glycosyltransferase involved in cell wall biosynthesis